MLIIPVSMSGQIGHAVEATLRRERSGRPLCARTGRRRMVWRTGQIDPKRATGTVQKSSRPSGRRSSIAGAAGNRGRLSDCRNQSFRDRAAGRGGSTSATSRPGRRMDDNGGPAHAPDAGANGRASGGRELDDRARAHGPAVDRVSGREERGIIRWREGLRHAVSDSHSALKLGVRLGDEDQNKKN